MEAWDLAWSPDGKVIASSSQTGAINLWTLESEASVGRLGDRNQFALSVAIVRAPCAWPRAGRDAHPRRARDAQSPDGKKAASGHQDGSVMVYDVRTSKLLHKFTCARLAAAVACRGC